MLSMTSNAELPYMFQRVYLFTLLACYEYPAWGSLWALAASCNSPACLEMCGAAGRISYFSISQTSKEYTWTDPRK